MDFNVYTTAKDMPDAYEDASYDISHAAGVLEVLKRDGKVIYGPTGWLRIEFRPGQVFAPRAETIH